MKILLNNINLQFKQGEDTISFAGFSYYYGKMGAGKTSIAKVIDYCLGGDLDLTPAMQLEFISAKLSLMVESINLTLERVREANQIIAAWEDQNGKFELIVPARIPNGELIPGSGVEVLSDLIFYLADIHPPKVRRSKQKEDSELERLSIRNLFWFCYLDQDSMDSSFFNLDSEAYYIRNKSKDVLRYIVGFHQERVAELETELQVVHERRMALQSGAESLKKALEGEGIGSSQELEKLINDLEEEYARVKYEIGSIRNEARKNLPHYIDIMQKSGRTLSDELLSITDAINSIEEIINGDQRHLNELKMLRVKFKRTSSAKSILAGVEFKSCPRCSQDLPKYDSGICPVCGQAEIETTEDNLSPEIIEADANNRIQELEDSIQRHSEQLANLKRRYQYLLTEKQQLDQTINEAMHEYDSAYLSNALGLERRKAEIDQTISKLKDYQRLSGKVDELFKEASALEGEESDLRRVLKEARLDAEKDNTNISKLENLFLDCLIRSHWPGIDNTDTVSIKSPNYLPEVTSASVGDLAVTSFSNISSGGKKSLFKTCFAVAMHRLAVSISANLPTLLIIDSPMKNISERENQREFEGFHQMLYELAGTELVGTQFILIDKEYLPPSSNVKVDFLVRHMTPDETNNPPLIKYYRGK